MPLSKIHLLKKVKNQSQEIVTFLKQTKEINKKLDELSNIIKLQQKKIELLENENDLIRTDMVSMTYAINVLNLVVENIVYTSDDYIKKIDYH